MKINTTITLKLDKEERDTLVAAAHILDGIYSNDEHCVLRFDVEKRNIIDPDDIACMLRTLVTLSDTDEHIGKYLEV